MILQMSQMIFLTGLLSVKLQGSHLGLFHKSLNFTDDMGSQYHVDIQINDTSIEWIPEIQNRFMIEIVQSVIVISKLLMLQIELRWCIAKNVIIKKFTKNYEL